jgi:hypothetical protein
VADQDRPGSLVLSEPVGDEHQMADVGGEVGQVETSREFVPPEPLNMARVVSVRTGAEPG